MQYTRVHDASRERAHQIRVRNAAEVVREVGIHHVQMAFVQRLFRIDYRLLGIAALTIGVLLGRKIGFPRCAFGTVVILSIIKRDAFDKPFLSVGSTNIRNNGAYVGSVVIAQSVMKIVA